MIAALQLKYNRGRQASITNDLVDIITGSFAPSHTPCRRSLLTPSIIVFSFSSRRCQRFVDVLRGSVRVVFIYRALRE